MNHARVKTASRGDYMPEETTQKKNAGNVMAAVLQKRIVSKPTYKGMPMIDISIAYPQVSVRDNVRVSQHISAFYRESAKQYYDNASHILFNDAVKEYINSLQQKIPFRAYQAVQTMETPYNRNSLLSIFYDRYEYTAGAHGNTSRYADTWRLYGAIRLELCDFFDGSYYKSVIFEHITNEIKSQINSGNTYYLDDYMKNVFRYFDEKNYYLTESGIAIFYPLYTIAAYALGIPVFVIPYNDFGPSLKKRLFE
jgi:hypothetical protein